MSSVFRLSIVSSISSSSSDAFVFIKVLSYISKIGDYQTKIVDKSVSQMGVVIDTIAQKRNMIDDFNIIIKSFIFNLLMNHKELNKELNKIYKEYEINNYSINEKNKEKIFDLITLLINKEIIFSKEQWSKIFGVFFTLKKIKIYENFIKLIRDTYINDILIYYSRNEITLFFNFILRNEKLLINYDFHLLKYNKFDYFI